MFGDLFGRGGRGRGRGRRARRGADIRADVTLDLLEAARGVTKTVKFDRHERCGECQGSGAKPGTTPETCRYCGGAGQVVQTTGMFRVQTTCPSCHGAGNVIHEPCRACGGEGQVKETVSREVRIPAGVDTEMRLRFRAKGARALTAARRAIATASSRSRNTRCSIARPNTWCANGRSRTRRRRWARRSRCRRSKGRDELEIPPGTQPGEVFKLRGRGMPDFHRRGKGDLLVQIQLEVPKSLTEKQEELLRELAEEEHRNVSPHRKSFFEKLRDYFIPDETAEAEE